MWGEISTMEGNIITMTPILVCILANVGIFICFRAFSVFRLHTLQAIVVNYLVCTVTGFVYSGGIPAFQAIDPTVSWLKIAVGLGLVFISTFYFMALTTQKFSITVSSIAAKMSLVIPVLFSVFVLGTQVRPYTWGNYIGIGLGMIAIVMSAYKERKIKNQEISRFDFLLPLGAFLLGGVIDTTINYTNHTYLTKADAALFTTIIFASAGLIGIGVLLILRTSISWKSVLGGAVLGGINYFSIYFLIVSLSAFDNDGALVYPMLNIGIILLSTFVSVLAFKERLSTLNKWGIVTALLALVLISYQEIF